MKHISYRDNWKNVRNEKTYLPTLKPQPCIRKNDLQDLLKKKLYKV